MSSSYLTDCKISFTDTHTAAKLYSDTRVTDFTTPKRWARGPRPGDNIRCASPLALNVRRTCRLRGCPPSAIGPSLLLLSVLGTVCPNMSRPHPLCLFSEVATGLSFSGVPSDDFYRNFCSACVVTVVIFGHLNRFFTFSFMASLQLTCEIFCQFLNTNML